MKKLLIVESPAKIKTIAKFLGKEFHLISSFGHVKDLPQRKLGVKLGPPLELEYDVLEGKKKVITDILKEARTSDEVFLAPDPDREGEIIAWHIGQEIAKATKNKAKIHRIAFNEITKSAVQQAIENPGSIDLQKVAAQQARRVLDRWVGYEVSPILWRKIQKGLSAGRVQSVALRLIVERENEIVTFKPQEYWSINGTFAHQSEPFIAELTHIGKKKVEIGSQQEAGIIVNGLKKESFTIDAIQDKTRKKNPAPPFMTSSLQQTAYNRLGFSVQKTMQLAQTLYEGVSIEGSPVALITYMRTDSLRLSQTALDQARTFITQHYGQTYVPEKAPIYTKAQAQDAHEAIRPIDVNYTPERVKGYLEHDAAKLYSLIWHRFVACQMNPAEYAQRQVNIIGGTYTFKVTGSTLIFDGFLKIYKPDDDEDEKKIKLPKGLKEKDAVVLQKIDPKQHFTQPPPRYTEGSLVKELEKEGIGRPSTYAAILQTIRKRSYTTLDDKKRFVPTDLGKTVTETLIKNLPQIMNINFTAHMEEDLDKVAEGTMQRDNLLNEFYTQFSKDLTLFKGTEKRSAEPTSLQCPQCKQHVLVIRTGKTGQFLGCAGYPKCTFTSNFTRNSDGTIVLAPIEKPKLLETVCPQCGKPLQERRGRFGLFIACSGYPTCKYTQPVKAQFACPLCKGDVIQKRWRGGVLWGCSHYPKCTFAVFGDIENAPCPQCALPFLTKKISKDGTVTLACWSKECGYTQRQTKDEPVTH